MRAESSAGTDGNDAASSPDFCATFEPTLVAAHDARRAFTAWAEAGEAHRVVEPAALVVDELAANAVLHARSRFEVVASWRASRLRVEVNDMNPSYEECDRDSDDTGGWGLKIVAAFAVIWGIDQLDDRKVIWAEFQLPPDA
jgi:hypothetical protein